MTRIAYARTFDGVDDQIQFTLGGLSGAWSGATVAAIVKTASGTNPGYDGSIFGISDTLDFSHARHNGLLDFYDYSTFQSWGSIAGLARDEWWLFARTKATGSNFPSTHYYRYSNQTMTHVPYGTLMPNLVSPGATVRAGSNQFSAFYTGMIACIGVWKSTALSDAQVDSLVSSLNGWNLLNPSALWLFNQPSVATAVVDRAGTSDQSSITGTTATAITDLPFSIGDLGPAQSLSAIG